MKRDAMVLELRVLGGRHAGACVAAEDGLLLYTDDTADVLLSDMDADAGALRLHLPGPERWLLWPAGSQPNAEALARAPLRGEARYFGGLPLCVSDPDVDWQDVPSPEAQRENQADAADSGTLAPATSTAPRMLHRLRVCVITLAGIGVVVLAVIKFWPPESTHGTGGPLPRQDAEPIDLTDEARRQIPILEAAILRVDPALVLHYTPLRDGHVRVTGWVDTNQQLDRIDDALNAQQPRPVTRVVVFQQLREELRAQLRDSYPSLEFAPGGPGRLKVSGLVTTEAERHAVMAAVRGQVSDDLDVESDLRMARAHLLADIAEAFTVDGFSDALVRWTGGTYAVTLSVPTDERRRFEAGLPDLIKRFPGVPLLIKPKFVSVTPVRSPPPFPISGVIGGHVPYVVLPDGSKLLPGGRHKGWRLHSIEAQVLIFDFPRRLVVAR